MLIKLRIVLPTIVVGVLTAPTAFAQTLPLAFWSFDDNAANPTLDDTGNGNNGTLVGTPAYDPDTPTQLGARYSLYFNGTTDYVALNMSMTNTGELSQLTASVWFKTNYASGTNFSNNWAFLDFDRSEYFNVYVTPDGRIGFSTTDTTGFETINTGTGINDMFSNNSSLNDGVWHHVAVVYDGNDKMIYVDGILDNTNYSPHSGRALGTGVTRYGFIGDGSEANTSNGNRNNFLYQGKIDEVAIWDVALSENEIGNIADGASILTITADIDIKPGSDPNSINLCSGGSVPVAVLGSDTFNASDIVTDSLRFAEAAIKVVGKKNNELCNYEDVNSDGYTDLVCKYVTTDITATDGETTSAKVNGELLDGTPFEGTDDINIVKDTCL
ncbi:MAG: LamG domain-containing protein [Pseudomonadota bacterium]